MADALDHLSQGATQIEWLSSLNTEFEPKTNYRRTSIICTIGPKTNSAEKINMLRKAGCNVVRMNFSHGEYPYHQSVIDNAREAEKQMPGRPVAIALDTVRFPNICSAPLQCSSRLTWVTERSRDPYWQHYWRCRYSYFRRHGDEHHNG